MKNSTKQYFKILIKYLKPQWKSVLLLVLFLGGSISMQLLNPQILRHFIDAAVEKQPIRNLMIGAIWFIIISAIQQMLAVGSTFMCQNVGWNATNALREDLVLHCIELDMSFHKSKQPGEMIERLDSDVNMMFDFFSKLILDILNSIVLIIGILILLVREDARISIVLGVFAVIAILIFNTVQSRGIHLWVKQRETSAKLFGFLGEQISNIEDIKTSGAVDNSIQNYLNIVLRMLPVELKAILVRFKLWDISIIVTAIATIIGLGFGGFLYKSGVITIGTVYLIFNYTELINEPLQQIRRNLGDLQKAEAGILRVEELFNMKPEVKSGTRELSSKEALSIRIENLSFEYAKDVPVIKDVSFNLEKGRTLGIVGRTGSGKTTLARIVSRLYDAKHGKILINGMDIKDISLSSLRDNVAYVTQDVQLFHGSIRDNLTLFDHEIGDETILKALEDIGLSDWILSMPEGLDTMLESKGSSLSTGEAQLMAFIRVFLKNPGLVILDEASSRLDPITERYMEKAIDKLLKGRSCIMIAHRLSTLLRADDILILDKGEVVEYGVRKELLNDTASKYSQLLQIGIEEVLV